MELDRRKGVELWRQIRQIIESEIMDGVYQAGDRLPTEYALAKRFGVNRHTVRRALGALEEAGTIRIEQGRGTFVQENVIDYRVGARTRFSENLSRQSRIPSGRLLQAMTVNAPADVARELHVEIGAPVILLETLGEADGRRISVARHFFPAERFPALIEAYEETGSVTRSLQRFGVDDYFRKRTKVTARMPTSEEARHLQQPRNRPIVVCENINVDRDGRVIEYGVTRMASDWVQIIFEPDNI
jgi:GntR family phosphonate transport system transcriptional regulator